MNSPLVLSDQSSAGGSLQCHVPVVDWTIPLRLPTHPSSREESDQDQRGSSRGGHRHHPLLAEEILVPPSPDDVRDPSPMPTQTGYPVTTPNQQRRALPHRHGDSSVDGVEAEWRTLQDKDFSEAAIEPIESKYLTWKTVFLVAITSGHKASEMHAL